MSRFFFTSRIFENRKILILIFLLGLFSIKPNAVGWNDYSRLATVQSLVENHTFIIDESDFIGTGDKVYINGHFYSDKPVIPSILGALAYWPLYQAGIELGQGKNLAQYLIVFLVIKLFWLAGIYAFYRCLEVLGANQQSCIYLTLSFGICSLFFTWSVTFNNHLIAASCLLLGFLHYLEYVYGNKKNNRILFSGLFFALAGVVDHAMAVFYIGFFILFMLIPSINKRLLIYYCLPLVVTVVPVFIINYSISGQFLPFQLIPEYFNYEGSHWKKHGNLTGSNINNPLVALEYSFNMFFGKRGFIIYNPLLLIGIPCLILEIIRQKKYKTESWAIVTCSLVIMFYYILTSNNYSGGSYSIRWFVPLLPFLLIFIYRYLENPLTNRLRYTFLPLCLLSLLLTLVGTINPWASLIDTKIPFVANTVYQFDLGF